jgi:hypothetical protein
MNRVMRLAVAAVLLPQFTLSSHAQDDTDLAIQLQVAHRAFELGTPIDLSLEFVNLSDTAFYLNRTDDFGPAAVDIIARTGTCVYRLPAIHFDVAASVRSSMFTRLLGGDRLIQELFRFADPESIGESFLSGPGPYMFQATFRSEGPSVASAQGPVWRGFVQSPEVRIVITPPSLARVERMRTALRSGLQTGDVDATSLKYFRLVKDPTAADLLVALLDKVPDNPFLLDAVAHQSRMSDGAALDRAAASATLGRDATMAAYARDLAKRVRSSSPCD